MPLRTRIISHVLGLIGAAAGGVLGYFAFWWIVRQGFYALILPGAFLGLGCGLLARHTSWPRGAACGAAALGLGLYTEWTFAPFEADNSFGYLVTHASRLRGVTLVMIVVGALIAFWVGKDGGFQGLTGGRKSNPPRDV